MWGFFRLCYRVQGPRFLDSTCKVFGRMRVFISIGAYINTFIILRVSLL